MRHAMLIQENTAEFRRLIILAPVLILAFSISASGEERSSPAGNAPVPVARQTGSWKVLFDGKSAAGWRGFRQNEFPSACWKIEDSTFHRIPGKASCGDIVSENQYSNFELELEWRISPAGNSGIKYLIPTTRPASCERGYMDQRLRELNIDPEKNKDEIASLKPDLWFDFPIGFEFQLIDDDKNPDAQKGPKRITGALYDMLAPTQITSHPVGRFHKARILVWGNHVEHWINDIKVLDFDLGSPILRKAITQSKFNSMEGFGMTRKGHITLQDHDCEAWFRNIRLRELPAK
jgi:hypothetical protein